MPDIVTGTIVSEPAFTCDCTVPEADYFTGDSILIFEQADWVAMCDLGSYIGDAVLPHKTNWHLIFSRRVVDEPPSGFKCNAQGLNWGEEIVAYKCDNDGVVTDWSQRLETRAHSFDYATRKLRTLLINGFAQYQLAPTED